MINIFEAACPGCGQTYTTTGHNRLCRDCQIAEDRKPRCDSFGGVAPQEDCDCGTCCMVRHIETTKEAR